MNASQTQVKNAPVTVQTIGRKVIVDLPFDQRMEMNSAEAIYLAHLILKHALIASAVDAGAIRSAQ